MGRDTLSVADAATPADVPPWAVSPPAAGPLALLALLQLPPLLSPQMQKGTSMSMGASQAEACSRRLLMAHLRARKTRHLDQQRVCVCVRKFLSMGVHSNPIYCAPALQRQEQRSAKTR